jgi:dihydrofolate reductase
MAEVVADISMSLDGFVAGRHDGLGRGLGDGGDQTVLVSGGASIIQQGLAGGLVTELRIHLAPVLLGAGTRLFEFAGPRLPRLEQTQVRHSRNAAHRTYRLTWDQS